jgi:nucleotide-binding universal stress UspA family protein
LHDAEWRVWTDTHEETTFERTGFQSVVCAVDLRDESIAAIQWAAWPASSYSARFTLVHAIPALCGPAAPGETKFCGYLVEQACEYLDDLQRRAGTQAEIAIAGGKIAKAVHNAVLAHRADVVVIGQGSLHETLGRLRTNAYSIIRESPCPVVRV